MQKMWFAANPEDTEQKHGILSYPMTREYKRSTVPQSKGSRTTGFYNSLKSRLKKIPSVHFLGRGMLIAARYVTIRPTNKTTVSAAVNSNVKSMTFKRE